METPATTPVARIHELETELAALESELSMRESELDDAETRRDNLEEWYGELRDAVETKLLPLFDNDYSPYGCGTLAWDAWLAAMPTGQGAELTAAIGDLAACYLGE